MKEEILLLIIDMQNDFCNPEGALYVRGAEEDVTRLAKFILTFESKIDLIILTQDNHNVIDISHPGFWEDQEGNPPPAFTEIDSDSIKKGIWRPRYEKERATEYISNLERQGQFPHVIWPEHCITGSQGAAIVNKIMEPVKSWARRGNYFDVVSKGTNPLTEHFGALKANIPIQGSPETQLNQELVNKFIHSDKIMVAGEAKSHCVATTIKQMLDIEGIAQKLVILEDCMSDVTGYETIALPIYKKAKENGAKFISVTELV